MGYKSSNHGVRFYIEQHINSAITRCTHPSTLVEDMCIPKERASVIIDGNISMFSVPGDIKTLEGYVDYIGKQVREYLRTFGQVIIIFDEPDYVPQTKVREQRERDVHQKRSLERETGGEPPGFVVERPHPSAAYERVIVQDDRYTAADLVGAIDCHQAMKHRPCRVRFIDEVMRRVYEGIHSELEAYSQLSTCTLALSGIDLRGANRAKDTPRDPRPVCSNEALADLLTQTSMIGEGDIKMRAIDNLLRTHTPASSRPELIAWVTTDLDSIGIGLLHVADLCERRLGAAARGPDFCALAAHLEDDELLNGTVTLVCAHEQRATCLRRARELCQRDQPVPLARKRARAPLEREDFVAPLPAFQIFEPMAILRHFCEKACSPQQLVVGETPYACLASGVVAAFALGGCDFVLHNTAQKASVMLSALINMCNRERGLQWLAPLSLRFESGKDSEQEIAPRLDVLRRIVDEAADITAHGGAGSGSRRDSHQFALRALCDAENVHGSPLRNAAWAVCYWSEEGNSSRMGGATPTFGEITTHLSAWGF